MGQYLDFKTIAESVDVEQIARQAKVNLKRSNRELRGACPACKTDDDRSLALYPETNSFRCYAAQLSGDSISLHAHLNGLGNYKAAKELAELFGTPTGGRTAPATEPQKPEGRRQPAPTPQKERSFDPHAYLAKLAYTEEVAALGITEEDATRLGIGYMSSGMHKQRVVFCVRNPDGSISGFVGVKPEDIKLPSTWLTSNVVQLRRA